MHFSGGQPEVDVRKLPDWRLTFRKQRKWGIRSLNQYEAQFERWLKQYRGLIYRVVMVYAPHIDAQEELFQEIALALWRSIEKFEQRSAESTWIYRVALNTAISHRRRTDRQPNTRSLESWDGWVHFDPERDQQLSWLYAQIRSMSMVDRSLALLYLEGNSYEDMATILGISQNSVGVKINRMKSRLRKLLEDE